MQHSLNEAARELDDPKSFSQAETTAGLDDVSQLSGIGIQNLLSSMAFGRLNPERSSSSLGDPIPVSQSSMQDSPPFVFSHLDDEPVELDESPDQAGARLIAEALLTYWGEDLVDSDDEEDERSDPEDDPDDEIHQYVSTGEMISVKGCEISETYKYILQRTWTQ